MINARAETVATASAYAAAFARHRCLVPADGWYEWRRAAGSARKQPYFMTPRDGGVVVFGGLWSRWGTEGDTLVTCSIVTMAAYGELTEVHDRMPLIVSPDRWAEWLSGPADAERLLRPPSPDALADLEIRPVGPAVGDVRNDGPELVRPLAMTLSDEPTGNPTDLTLF
jgi:putative SOS response-associated peptidase YedK